MIQTEHGTLRCVYVLREFVNGHRIYGTPGNVDRYIIRYHQFEYRHHSTYFALDIERAYDGPQAKAMYRAEDPKTGIRMVGGSLDEVKR